MNGLLFILVIGVAAVRVNDAADMDLYQDMPEDYIIEQVASRLQQQRRQLQRLQQHPLQRHDTPEPLFSFQFPPGADHEASEFAVRPPDPRYYHDTRGYHATETEEMMQPSVRQTLLDDDTFDPPPRPVKLSTPPAQREDLADVRRKADDDVNDVRRKADDDVNDVRRKEDDVGGEREKETSGDITRVGDTGAGQYKEDGALYAKAEITHSQVVQRPVPETEDKSDLYFIAIVAGCSAAAVVGVIVIAVSWYKLQRNAKAAADVEYPAYGVTGPNKETSPTGDRKLAQSAQMYHYQHQKQQIIAMENRVANERNDGSMSEAESDEENEEGDYTVYECPGLAPTGEMEVKNPLFLDDPTPATPATAGVNSSANNQNTAKSPPPKNVEKVDKK